MARGYAAPRSRARAPRIDPLAPLGPRALRRQVAGDVRAQTIPLARELTRQINAQAAAGAANIAGVSNQLATTLQGAQGAQREIYDRARGNLGAIDTQQANALGTAGGGLADALAARLQSAGAPSTLADSLRSQMGGAVGAGLAKGGAQQGELALNQAGAESYAAKLPGLAQLAGLQGVSERRAQAQRDLATQLGALNARVPGLIAQETEAARNREYQKGVARLGFAGDVAKLNAADAQNAARIRAENQRANQSNATRRQANQIRREAITAENQRTGKTLSERAREHNRSLDQQSKHDQQTHADRVAAEKGRERRSRRSAKVRRETSKSKGGSGVWTPK